MTGEAGADLVDRVRDRLAATGGVPSPADVAEALRVEARGVLGDVDFYAALRHLQSELTGAGPLEPLLARERVTDVLVTRPGDVWVDDGAGLRHTGVEFPDEAAVRRLAHRLAIRAGHRLDEATPWVDGVLPAPVGSTADGIRLHAVIPPVATAGTCLSLRVLRPRTMRLDDLVAGGAVPGEAAGLLRGVIAARLAFLVVGGTGSGKTTLLSALLGEVDAGERIVLVEDAAELDPVHPHVVGLLAREANVEGAGRVTLRDLIRQALRMRPDRLVVGEVRGAEVVDLLAALNTGHDGGAGTVHANGAGEVPARLEALAAAGGLGREALHAQFAAAIRVVLTMRRAPGGRRELVEIGVTRRGDDGLVCVCTAWTPAGPGPAAAELAGLVRADRAGGTGGAPAVEVVA